MTTYLGKSCSFGLLRVPFVNCRQSMYLVISLLVLRAGCGILLYQFLIIAYHFTYYFGSNLPVDIVLCRRVLRLLPGGSASMFFYMLIFPFFILKSFGNTNGSILMDFV